MNHVTHPLSSDEISIFLSKIRTFLLYQKIQILTAFSYIIPNSYNIFWVFKDYFNKNGYDFDNVRKNGYSRPS